MRDTQAAPRFLFVPVSGRFGMGEFARSLAIAHAARERWPAALVHFVLSREAPYALDIPFASTLVPSSPTFHSREVIAVMERMGPDVVLFDNAGRTAQLAAASRMNARIVFISARRRQRSKAFRWRWMRMMDEHWIAYPRFAAGGLRPLERLKLRFLGRPVVRFLDVILPRADRDRRAAILARAHAPSGRYVLFVPGGGTGHPGVDDAGTVFARAAVSLGESGVAAVCVGAGAAAGQGVRRLPLIPLADLAELMRSAAIVVANGGSTLVQAIACGTAVVAVPIAGDQGERIRRCVEAGVAVQAALNAPAIAAAVQALLDHESDRAALGARASALGLADGLEVAVEALAGLIGAAAGPARQA